MRELLRHAARLGVTVHIAHIENPQTLGYFDRALSQIVLAFGMTHTQTRCVLAHELAHAALGHTHSTGPAERRADQLAASLLIAPEAYRCAEQVADDEASIAAELGVTAQVVSDYRRLCLQRVGETTYLRPKMGRGQHAFAGATVG